MRLSPGDVGHGCIAATGVYEYRLSRRVVARARSGGLLVDVGANAGYFSMLWAAAGPHCEVLAVEPGIVARRLLEHNVAANKLTARIRIVAAAAGREAQRMPFDSGLDGQTGWAGLTRIPDERTAEVQVRRLDDLLPAGFPVAMLKIDTEGADTWVLQGADSLLRSKAVAEIHFEQNRPRMRALGIEDGAASDYLDSVGYRARPLGDSDGDVVAWVAGPKATEDGGSRSP